MAKSPQKQEQMKRILMFTIGFVTLIVFIRVMVRPQEEPAALKFYEFMQAVESADPNEKVVEVTFKENEITGLRGDMSKFKTYGPNDAEMREALVAKGVKVNFEPPEEMSWWKGLLLNSLPLLLIIFLFFFIMRQLQIGGGKAMSFGKSRAKLLNENQTKVTFEDVAGIDEAKQELEEIIEFLRDPKKFTRLGGRIPKGVLLVGSPGTGKTILAKAIAGEAGVPFFSISGSDFVEMFVGVGASRVRDLFEQAKKHAPCIVFIDEIDAVGRHRGAGLGGGHDEREQTLNQLLVEMDGFESNEGVIIVAATNRPDVLDPALLRPGRFDRRVTVPNPDVRGRVGILKVHSRKTPLAKDVEMNTIAQGTPGFSGADLENLVNEAALIAARKNNKEVHMEHFELAKDKILMGPERRSMFMGLDEKRNTAYHEAGHALVGLLVGHVDPVHKVSIIPRGQALGVTVLLPSEDRYTMTKEFAVGMIAYAMGGRAAEDLIFNKQTTGASDDINKATDIARRMVCNWGMSEKLGPLSLGKQQEEVFLGKDFGSQRNYSEKVAEEIDKEIHRFVTDGYKNAYDLLKRNRSKLEAIAETLLIKETLDKRQMEAIMAGEELVSEEERKAFYEAQKKKPALDTAPESDSADTSADSADENSGGTDDETPIGALPQGT